MQIGMCYHSKRNLHLRNKHHENDSLYSCPDSHGYLVFLLYCRWWNELLQKRCFGMCDLLQGQVRGMLQRRRGLQDLLRQEVT